MSTNAETPKNEKREVKKNNKKRTLTWILVLAGAIVLALLILNSVLNLFLKDKIVDGIRSSSKVTKANIESISYSLFRNGISVSKVNIEANDTSAAREYSVKVEEASINGISWFGYLFNDDVSLSELEIINPVIEMYDSSSAPPKKNSGDGEKETKKERLFTQSRLQRLLPDAVGSFASDKITVKNAVLHRKMVRGESVVIDTLDSLDVSITDAVIDTTSKDKKLIVAEDIEVNIKQHIRRYETVGNDLKSYGIKVSSSDSLIAVDSISLKPFRELDDFFARRQYTSDRFILEIDDFELDGIDFAGLVNERKIAINEISINDFFLDVMTDKRPPVNPNSSPKMPSEILGELGFDIKINKTTAAGALKIKALHNYFDEPAVLSFSDVKFEMDNFTNYGDSLTRIKADGKMQETAPMNVYLSIDLTNPSTDFSYKGGMAAMEASKLNKYLTVENKVVIKSGMIEEITFDVNVTSGLANGTLKPIYKDLDIQIIDKKTKEGKPFITFLANAIKLRASNPNEDGELKIGNTRHQLKPKNTFLDMLWLPLLNGLGEVAGF